MGHALNGSIQDALIRWHRMRGFNALWQPGYDHAGIATQSGGGEAAPQGGDVAIRPRPRGVRRARVGVAAGVRRRDHGPVPAARRSLDYERERFTMDDAYVRAVMRFFVHLYERGWLYRDNRIVNWCQ